MTNNLFIVKSKKNALLASLSLLSILGCRTTNDDVVKGGIGSVKVNIAGLEFSNNHKNVMAMASMPGGMMSLGIDEEAQTIKTPLKGGYVMVATLTPASSSLDNLQASASAGTLASVQEKVPNGIKYRVAVFDSNGKFVSQKVYTTGSNSPDDGKDLQLDGGKSYKFVVYSYNNGEIPPVMDPEHPELSSISGNKDFMYFSTEKVISGETTNYLDVVMKHKYTKVNIKLTTEDNENITEFKGDIGPHHIENKVNLLNGELTYDKDSTNLPLVVTAGLNTKQIESSPIFSAKEGKDGLFTMNSIKVGSKEYSNRSFKFEFKAGMQYNLNLKVKKEVTFDISQASSSVYHTVILTKGGEVFGTGYTNEGQLGFTRPYDNNDFVNLNVTDAKSVVAGNGTTFILKNSGDLYASGINTDGQAGTGSKSNLSSFTKIEFNGGKIKEIFSVWKQSFIITEAGEVFGTGNNYYGQIGTGIDYKDRANFVKTKGLENVKVENITGGKDFTIVRTTDGQIFGAGYNEYGQLGNAVEVGKYTNSFKKITSISEPIREVKSGKYHTLLLTASGKLYTAGYNSSGSLGTGDTKSKADFTEITGISNALHVYGFEKHSMVLAADGSLYAAGNNDYGQLGFGDTTDRNKFEKIPLSYNIKNVLDGAQAYHTIVFASDGQVFGCGYNRWGELGIGNYDKTIKSFVKLPLINK
ncbi:hypothetical protein J2O08_13525 [Elizabethkingia anophelis]|uniref:fimbrillin family protein n=1 Tax=Elizabethkingia anophelis TaxID=1117645 RepID=UPI0020B38F4D|nr:fimbrillin family protein [Elizabethkingia anophelis]UTF92220.1 hypothetical protein J2O08_13525 [Elizabethkingia anophelis]